MEYVPVEGLLSSVLKDWKIKVINANGQFEFETLWCKITTPNSEFFAASVYHPPDPIYEPADLLNFL